MEIEEKRVFELFLGLIFVALLIIISLLVIYLPGQTKITSKVISNSYNSDSYNDYKIVQKDKEQKINEYKNYFYYEKEGVYLSYGKHSKNNGFFGNYKDEFKVYVVNKNYMGHYFKVEFYFCDYYGNCFSRTMQKYIPAKQEKMFVYVDVQNEKYKYYKWEYKIFPDY